MSTYIIGDVHGCYASLESLLKTINFNTTCDRLYFCGDLINRGKESEHVLSTLLTWSEQGIAHTVLGNHELALLFYSENPKAHAPNTHFDRLLSSPEADRWIHWLKQQPFLHRLPVGFIVHAGIWPTWSIEETYTYAEEAAEVLRTPSLWRTYASAFHEPRLSSWDPQQAHPQRWFFFLHTFTRMRHLAPINECWSFVEKDQMHAIPWYQALSPQWSTPIYFGHWSALRGRTDHAWAHALDTGCVWGDRLTALRLEDHQRFEISCSSSCYQV